jgi:hypothetical protein
LSQLPQEDASAEEPSRPITTHDASTAAKASEPADSGSGGTDPDASQPPPPPPPPTASKPAQGEVVISEVMYDPSGPDPAGEWIEVYNTTSSPKSLSGLTIVDGGDRTNVIGTGVTVGPKAYVLLVRSKSDAIAAGVPSASIVYEYGAGAAAGTGVQLANGSTGAVYLRNGSTTIAEAVYGGWFSQSGGSSIQLKTLTYSAAAQSYNWCLSSNAWALGSDNGTPGSASDCP